MPPEGLSKYAGYSLGGHTFHVTPETLAEIRKLEDVQDVFRDEILRSAFWGFSLPANMVVVDRDCNYASTVYPPYRAIPSVSQNKKSPCATRTE